MTIFVRNIRNWRRDCGAVNDNATNNDAAALVAAGHMAWGQFVEDTDGGPH